MDDAAVTMLAALGWALLYLEAFYALFIAAMGLYRAHLARQLTPFAKVAGAPILLVMLVMDWLANWTLALVIFVEAPEDPLELVTARLTRYIGPDYPDGRKKRWAAYVCTNLLDMMDPRGRHCLPT